MTDRFWEQMEVRTIAEREQLDLRAAMPFAPEDREARAAWLGRTRRTLARAEKARRIRAAERAARRERFVARSTVYTMNLTVMALSFPVGFGLMMLNVIGGESLRTTAHVMALTGFGMALSMTETGARIFSALPI